MIRAIGQVREVDGTFYAQAADTDIRSLKAGDVIFPGDVVYGHGENAAYDTLYVTLDKGLPFDILLVGAESQCFDASLGPVEFSEDETSVTPDSLMDFSREFSEDPLKEAVEKSTDDLLETSKKAFVHEEAKRPAVAQESLPEQKDGDPRSKVVDERKVTKGLSSEVDVDKLLSVAEEAMTAAYERAREANEKATDANLLAEAIAKGEEKAAKFEHSRKEVVAAATSAMDAARSSREIAERIEAAHLDDTVLKVTRSASHAYMAANSAENAAINATNASADVASSQEEQTLFLTQSLQDAADAANIAARQTEEAAIIVNNTAAAVMDKPGTSAVTVAISSQKIALLRAANAKAVAANCESVADRAGRANISTEAISHARDAVDNAESASVNASKVAREGKAILEATLQPRPGDGVASTDETAKEVVADAEAHSEGLLLTGSEEVFCGRSLYTLSVDLERRSEDMSSSSYLVRQYDGRELDLYLLLDADGTLRYAEKGRKGEEDAVLCEMVSPRAIDLDIPHNIMVVKEESMVMVLIDGTLLFMDESMPTSLRESVDVKIVLGESARSALPLRRVGIFDTALSMIEIASVIADTPVETGPIVDILLEGKIPGLDRSGNGHEVFRSAGIRPVG